MKKDFKEMEVTAVVGERLQIYGVSHTTVGMWSLITR